MIDAREKAVGQERKVFGDYETIELPVRSYARLPQVRSGMNPDLPDIKESIRTRGLINQIDAARLSESQLATYINFVNRTWKTDADIEDYAMQRQPSGDYYLVVAGHTRTEAVYQLEQENEAGYEYIVVAKVHNISTPEEIIALQLDENLHSKPSQEQRAIAIVETYRYGLENGQWANKTDFMRQSGGKFSRRILNEAMGFAQLPPEARDFVFSGQLSYNAAVALGVASDTIMDYVAAKLRYNGMALSARAAQELDDAYRQEVALMIARLSNRQLNGTAAKKFIAGQAASMQDISAKIHNSDEEGGLFELSMVSAREQAEAYRRQLEKDYRATLREMKQRSIESVTDALRLHRQLVGEAGIEDLNREAADRRRLIGRQALLDIPSPRPVNNVELVMA